MKKELLAKAIRDLFFGGNWTDVNLRDTLSGIGYQAALTAVPFSENTIAKLLYHLKYSNDIVTARANGEAREYDNEKEGFAAPVLQSDADWQQLISDTNASAERMCETIRNFDEARLTEPIVPGFSSAERHFMGISEHAHYHLGQMVLIKKYLEISGNIRTENLAL